MKTTLFVCLMQKFLAGPQRASPTNAKVCHWVTDWVMKLQDWSADCRSFLIGRCSFKMKRRRTVLCLRFSGERVSGSMSHDIVLLLCMCYCLYLFKLRYVVLRIVLPYKFSASLSSISAMNWLSSKPHVATAVWTQNKQTVLWFNCNKQIKIMPK